MKSPKAKNNHFKLVLLTSLFVSAIALPTTAQESVIVGTVSVALETPLTLELSSRSSVFINKSFNLKAELKNIGQNDVDGIIITLNLPVGLTLTKGDLVQNIGRLKAGKKTIVSWRIQASELGDYIVQVQASGIEQNSNKEVEAVSSLTVNVKNRGFIQTVFESVSTFFKFLFRF